MLNNSTAEFYTTSQPTSMKFQQGASVTSIVFTVFALGIFLKLAIAILPAQVGDYQFTTLVSNELKKANDKKQKPAQFMKSLKKQLSVNSDYTSNPEEILVFTNNSPGNLTVRKQYDIANNFMGNVYIVNKFEGDIKAAEQTE